MAKDRIKENLKVTTFASRSEFEAHDKQKILKGKVLQLLFSYYNQVVYKEDKKASTRNL